MQALQGVLGVDECVGALPLEDGRVGCGRDALLGLFGPYIEIRVIPMRLRRWQYCQSFNS